jgi:hypothetical protein
VKDFELEPAVLFTPPRSDRYVGHYFSWWRDYFLLGRDRVRSRLREVAVTKGSMGDDTVLGLTGFLLLFAFWASMRWRTRHEVK